MISAQVYRSTEAAMAALTKRNELPKRPGPTFVVLERRLGSQLAGYYVRSMSPMDDRRTGLGQAVRAAGGLRVVGLALITAGRQCVSA